MSTLQALDQNDQILVIDDASQDETADILNQIKDPRISIRTNPHNLGVSACLNIGLKNTETKFVARMDADDICLPWRFDLQKKRIKKADAIFGNAVYFYPSKPFLSLHDVSLFRSEVKFRRDFLRRNPLLHPTMFARTDLIKDFGYKESVAEDYELWMRMLLKGIQFKKTTIPLILYRKHSTQLSANLKKEHYENDLVLRETFKEYANHTNPHSFSDQQYLTACGLDQESK
jgi:glycosyltransferase involved in cell wall biosynthesis